MRWMVLGLVVLVGCSDSPVEPEPEPEPEGFRVELTAFVESRDVSALNGVDGQWMCRLDLLALAIGGDGEATLGAVDWVQTAPEATSHSYGAETWWTRTDLPADGFRYGRISVFATDPDRIAYEVTAHWTIGAESFSETVPVECVPE